MQIDSRHRYGNNLHPYHEKWRNSSTNQDFFFWWEEFEVLYCLKTHRSSSGVKWIISRYNLWDFLQSNLNKAEFIFAFTYIAKTNDNTVCFYTKNCICWLQFTFILFWTRVQLVPYNLNWKSHIDWNLNISTF